MSLRSTLGNIARTAWKLGTILLPILRALREVSPDVDRVMDTIDEVMVEGGDVADDFFDRNLETIQSMKGFGNGLADLGVEISALCDRIILASQVDSPETITLPEAQVIGERVLRVKDKIAALVSGTVELEKALEKMA